MMTMMMMMQDGAAVMQANHASASG